VANWRKTRMPGVYVAHTKRCPAFETPPRAAIARRRGVGVGATRSRASPEALRASSSTERCQSTSEISDAIRGPNSEAEAWARQGRLRAGKVVDVSVMSGKIGARVDAAWRAAGLNRITLHECRHTYASLLMAAGYTITQLMEFMGHADVQMVNRYVKLLLQPGEDDAADRLNAYLRRSDDGGAVPLPGIGVTPVLHSRYADPAPPSRDHRDAAREGGAR
jgi:Phage integrase family